VSEEKEQHRPAGPWWWVAVKWLVAALAAGLITRDVRLAAAFVLLMLAWRLLGRRRGPFILALAFTHQWLQVAIAPLYASLTGRTVDEMKLCDHRPMLTVALVALAALLFGMRLGLWILRRPSWRERPEPTTGGAGTILWLYVFATLVAWLLRTLTWERPELSQILVAVVATRLGVLLLIFRRLARPPAKWGWLFLLMTFELGVNAGGFYAGFRETFVVAALALLEYMEPRKISHWAGIAAVAVVAVFVGVMWTGIKQDYRRSFRDDGFEDSSSAQFDRLEHLSGDWVARDPATMLRDVDRLVERLWSLEYQALALERIPERIPHEHGRLLWGAIEHVLTPRLLNPDKRSLRSDSEMVKRYAGVWVASDKQGTNIAFGYVGESYVDFGVPLMFIPVFAYGLLMGLALRFLQRNLESREIDVAATCAIFWPALYLYERSWTRTLGMSFMALIVVGGGAVVVDRVLHWRRSMTRGPADARIR
jgi:hypothetical protein